MFINVNIQNKVVLIFYWLYVFFRIEYKLYHPCIKLVDKNERDRARRRSSKFYLFLFHNHNILEREGNWPFLGIWLSFSFFFFYHNWCSLLDVNGVIAYVFGSKNKLKDIHISRNFQDLLKIVKPFFSPNSKFHAMTISQHET